MASLVNEQLSLFAQALMCAQYFGGYGLVHESYLVESRKKRLLSQYT